MLRPLIKICGISTIEGLDAAITARADYFGIVFFPPSPRHVDGYAASALAARAGSRIGRVGLFVDAGNGRIAEAVDVGRLDAIQLHGGYGYSREFPVERLMRDNKLNEIGAGTNEVMIMIIAKNLLSQK